MPITPSLRHYSNKYKLAREAEKGKEKDEDIEKGIRYIKLFYLKQVFSCCLKIDRDPAFRMGVGRSFHYLSTPLSNHSTIYLSICLSIYLSIIWNDKMPDTHRQTDVIYIYTFCILWKRKERMQNSLFPLIFGLLILSSSRCPLWQHHNFSQTQTNKAPAANQRKVAHDIWEQISKFRAHAMLSGRTSHFILWIFRSFSFSTFVALGSSDV